MTTLWPFKDAENTAVFTSKKILNGTDWIYYVTHDSDDGAWQFHGHGGPTPAGEASVMSLKSILCLDDSIRELADLPLGWHAWRNALGTPWTCKPMHEQPKSEP
jgi:hypothetical protein